MVSKEVVIDDRYNVIKTLGKGYSSKVVLAEDIETKQQLAIKIFKPQKGNKTLEVFNKEMDIMKNLYHENLVNLICYNEKGIMIDDRTGKKEEIIYLGLELASNAELFDYIADPKKEFDEKCARNILRQIVQGLISMQKVNISHRDLKTENIFLNDNFTVKVGDFGFAKKSDKFKFDGLLKTNLGTNGYQSPEMLEGSYYSGEDNDVFALGVILFILTGCYPPFREAKKTDNWYRHLYFDKVENFWLVHKKFKGSYELKDLISKMLSYKERITLEQITQHKWYNGEILNEEEYKAEMSWRKKLVDERRQREANEVQSQNLDNNTNNYRCDELYQQLFKQTDEICIDIPEDLIDSSKYTIKYESQDYKEVFKSLIKMILDQEGKVTINGPYCFDSEISYSSGEIPGDEDSFSLLKFNCNLYIKDKYSVAEFLKDPDTNLFEFNNFFNNLKSA